MMTPEWHAGYSIFAEQIKKITAADDSEYA